MNRIALLAALILVWAGSASAATIDFEEFNLGDGGGSIYDSPILTSQGYEFSGNGVPYQSAEVISGTNTGGTNAYGGYASGFGQDGLNFSASVHMERTDGSAFAIHSLDMFLDSDVDGFTSLRGVLAGYSGVANLAVPVGTGDWLNLQYLELFAEGNGFGYGYATVEIDNIVVSAVPIPAAVWLFGSALAGLGWIRRKTAS